MSNRRKLPRDTKSIVLSAETRAYVDNLDVSDGGQRRNSYTCETCCGTYLTIDIDPGVTPMVMRCFATEGCPGEATSGWYRAIPAGDALLEWYRPELAKGLTAGELDHVKRGGLLHRAAATAPDWVKQAHGARVAP